LADDGEAAAEDKGRTREGTGRKKLRMRIEEYWGLAHRCWGHR
jgi:hypothetical protein